MADGVDPLRGEVARAVNERALEAPQALLAGGRSARAPATGSPHSAKFRVATALLTGIAVAAVVVALAVGLTGHGSAPGAAWSSWSPPDGGLQGAREIAAHIAPLYRIDSTNQLAVVSVVDVASAAQTAASASGGSSGPSSGLEVAVQAGSGSGQQLELLSGDTLGFNLCGVGSTNCSIGVGTPSTARLLLLRREAMELALYSFKYLGSVQNVIAILPPGHSEQATSSLSPTPPTPTSGTKPVNIAVLFTREELAPFLAQPLGTILPEQFPPTVDQINAAPEAGLVEQVTARGLFSERLAQAQDGSSVLELTQLPPQ